MPPAPFRWSVLLGSSEPACLLPWALCPPLQVQLRARWGLWCTPHLVETASELISLLQHTLQMPFCSLSRQCESGLRDTSAVSYQGDTFPCLLTSDLQSTFTFTGPPDLRNPMMKDFRKANLRTRLLLAWFSKMTPKISCFLDLNTT